MAPAVLGILGNHSATSPASSRAQIRIIYDNKKSEEIFFIVSLVRNYLLPRFSFIVLGRLLFPSFFHIDYINIRRKMHPCSVTQNCHAFNLFL